MLVETTLIMYIPIVYALGVGAWAKPLKSADPSVGVSESVSDLSEANRARENAIGVLLVYDRSHRL